MSHYREAVADLKKRAEFHEAEAHKYRRLIADLSPLADVGGTGGASAPVLKLHHLANYPNLNRRQTRAVKEYERGATAQEVGGRYGVSKETVLMWVKKAGRKAHSRGYRSPLGRTKPVTTPEAGEAASVSEGAA